MALELLTVGQWRIVALATVPLLAAAVYFCLRSRRAAALSLVAPAAGGLHVLGAAGRRDHTEVEALVMFVLAMIAIAFLLVIIRPEMRRSAQGERTGEKYEIPKWKIYLYPLPVLAVAIVPMFVLLP